MKIKKRKLGMKLSVALFWLALFFAIPFSAHAANRFWVGGSGGWGDNTTTHWSATSGGIGGASVPNGNDDVFFDAGSSASAYTVTHSSTVFANCKNLTIGAPASGKITFTGNGRLNIFGNLNLVGGTAGIAEYGRNGSFTEIFAAASGTVQTITTNGVLIGGSINSVNAGATVRLLDNLTMFNTTNTTATGINISIASLPTNGTFDSNGFTVTMASLSAVIGTGTTNPTNFSDLVIAPTVPSKNDSFILGGNINVSNLLTISDGAILTNRVLVQSNGLGTPRTITAAAVSLSNVDFADITGAGAAIWSGTSIGDTGGNSGITFTPAVDQHWTAGSGNWSDVTRWTSRVPLPQDNVFIDVPGVLANADMPRLGKTLDWTNAPNSRMQINGNTLYGSFIGAAVMTDFPVNVATLVFAGRGNFFLDPKGMSFRKNIFLSAPGGTLTLLSALNTNTGVLQTNAGIFSAGAFPITTSRIVAQGGLLKLGSAIHIITGSQGTQTIFGSSGATLDAETSTVKFTDPTNAPVTLDPSGGTLNNVWFARGASQGNNVIKSSNTFNDFRDTGTAAHNILFFQFTTQTIHTFSVSGTPGNLITLSSGVGVTVLPATTLFSLVKTGGGPVSADFLNIQHSVATPVNTWFAGTHSVNNQGVATAGSGWIFTDPFATFQFKSGGFQFKSGGFLFK